MHTTAKIARRWQKHYKMDDNTMKKLRKIAQDHDCYIAHVVRQAIGEYYDTVYPERRG